MATAVLSLGQETIRWVIFSALEKNMRSYDLDCILSSQWRTFSSSSLTPKVAPVTKTEFLITVSIQYQADRWWELLMLLNWVECNLYSKCMIMSTIWNKSIQVNFSKANRIAQAHSAGALCSPGKINECWFIPNGTKKIMWFTGN